MGKNTVKRFTSDEIAVYCEQIAMMLNGGIPIFEATYIIYSEMEDDRTKEVLRLVDEKVKESLPLYVALEETNAFPSYMIHMVKVGETTGKLEEVMRSLSTYYERESNVIGAIKTAVAYPVVLFSMMSVIFVVLAWKILPMFEEMFAELSKDVSVSTENALGFGIAAGKTIAIVTCSILVIILLVLLFYKTKKGNRVIKEFVTGFKWTGKLSFRMAIGKFVSSLSLMLSGGMNILEALEIALGSAGHKEVENRIRKCMKLYEENQPLDEALRDSHLIEGMEGRMVTVAVKSGATDEIFEKLSNQYNEEITESLTKVSSKIETVLVVVLSLLVGMVLLSVMVPLVSMISSIG